MSIRLRDTKLVLSPSGDTLEYASESVELCACSGSGGEAKAFLPVKILGSSGSNPSVATLSELKVSSDTQANSRGVRRVMVKVELPYQSLPEADVRASGGIVDPRRSGQSLSAHVVVSVPRSAAEDLTGSRGTDAQRAAIAQVRGAIALLISFACPEMAGAVKLNACTPDGTDVPAAIREIPADGQPINRTEAPAFYTNLGAKIGVPRIVPDALNGQTGLTFEDLASAPMDGYDPLWRGLLGQKPLTCQQEVSLPAVDMLTII